MVDLLLIFDGPLTVFHLILLPTVHKGQFSLLWGQHVISFVLHIMAILEGEHFLKIIGHNIIEAMSSCHY